MLQVEEVNEVIALKQKEVEAIRDQAGLVILPFSPPQSSSRDEGKREE